jgi:hypothetical protein
MSKKRQDVQDVIDYLLQGPNRSSLFWWLVDHHDELAEAAGTKPIRWGPLAVRLASYGLTDRENKAATPETVRQTWKRARRFVVEEAVAKQARALLKKQNPSRLPATWRPQEAALPPRPGVGENGPVSGPPANETPEERTTRIIANIRQTIKGRSG